ncbi:hypothetical protein Q9L58_005552 [Maublancomyces gigas]|uniref:Uncharacterized protein n=1 Tax=Discina gigas TaxID=1032678 RepID=A0ABR3GHT5_9PEZI
MPNKRRRAKNAPALDFELEPTALAKTSNLSSTKSRLHERRKRKPNTRTFENEDDTPKAFARLMAFASGARKLPKGLDNGIDRKTQSGKNKKRKRTAEEVPKPKLEPDTKSSLSIQPGETLHEFNRRVDASLPVQIKLAREPRKPKKKPEPVVEKEEEEEGDYDDGEGGGGKRRRGKNKGGGRGASPDPWAGLAERREAPKFGDVAAQPPSLAKPKAVLHSRGITNVGGVPKNAGSLAKREGLAVERKGVVEAYRRMMEGKRGQA